MNNQLCWYYTVDSYNNILESFNLTLMNYNIRSFRKNSVNFISFLDTLRDLPNFIVVTETWNNFITVDLCEIPNYKGIHTVRESNGGGCSLFFRSNLKVEKIDRLSPCNDDIEVCCAFMKTSNKKLIIVCIYRPPLGSIENFLNQLDTILSDEFLSNNIVIVSGDININLANIESEMVCNYTAVLNSYQFLPTITLPTRFPPNDANSNPSILDHIFLNYPTVFLSGIVEFDQTDHCPVFIKFNVDLNENDNTMVKFQFREHSQSLMDSFNDIISTIDWQNKFINDDLNSNTSEILKTLDELYCKHFPLKTKIVSQRRLSNPWLTPNLLMMIKTKSNYFKLLKNNLISQRENNVYRNKVNREVREAKRQYLTHKFHSLKNDLRKSWKLISNLSGFGKRKFEQIELIEDDAIISDEKLIATKFNCYFSNIASRLDSSIAQSNVSPLTYLDAVNIQNSLHLNPVENDEIANVIRSLKNSGSGLNCLPVKIFKSVSEKLLEPLKYIINKSFRLGIFPDILKIARITPIHKKSSKLMVENYRPISSLHYLSKILERCMATRLVSFLDQNEIISKTQYGFQRGKGTFDALSDLIETIYKGLNNHDHNIATMIDLSKAFDTVNHHILIQKLEKYGIVDNALELFQCYLRNRKHFVKIGNSVSDMMTSNIGVPQGSILGPILFLIYINDLPQACNLAKPIIFADDTTLVISNKDNNNLINNLNHELNEVFSWCQSNRLTVNTNKTEILLFSNRNFPPNHLEIMLNDEILNFIECSKLLGVFIDEKLSFKSHVKHVISKISKNTGILYQIRDFLNIESRINFYYAFIYPYLSYNVTLWGNIDKTTLQPLIIQQKRAIRTLCKKSKFEHTNPLFLETKILKFNDIFRHAICSYMHEESSSGNYRIQHSVATRQLTSELAIPTYQRLSQTQRSISFIGPTIWNSLPSDLRQVSSICSFKRKLKDYFLQQYRE